MNRELRFEIAAKALAEARSANRSGAAILVEGKRDRSILENLGFNGEIILLNRGWTIEITTRLQSLDVAIALEPRRTLSRTFRPETLCVEGIRKFIIDLRPLIDVNDPEGADELHLL